MGILVVSDVALNDSDKSLIPSGTSWRVRRMIVNLVTTATAGARQLVLTVEDGSTVLFKIAAGITQIASLTHDYVFFAGAPRETALIDDSVLIPIPDLLLVRAGVSLRVRDSAAIDAAADDMTIQVIVETV